MLGRVTRRAPHAKRGSFTRVLSAHENLFASLAGDGKALRFSVGFSWLAALGSPKLRKGFEADKNATPEKPKDPARGATRFRSGRGRSARSVPVGRSTCRKSTSGVDPKKPASRTSLGKPRGELGERGSRPRMTIAFGTRKRAPRGKLFECSGRGVEQSRGDTAPKTGKGCWQDSGCRRGFTIGVRKGNAESRIPCRRRHSGSGRRFVRFTAVELQSIWRSSPHRW